LTLSAYLASAVSNNYLEYEQVVRQYLSLLALQGLQEHDSVSAAAGGTSGPLSAIALILIRI